MYKFVCVNIAFMTNQGLIAMDHEVFTLYLLFNLPNPQTDSTVLLFKQREPKSLKSGKVVLIKLCELQVYYSE